MARIKKHVVFPVYGYHAKTRDVIMIESQEFGKIVRVMQYKSTFCFQYCDTKPGETEMILREIVEDLELDAEGKPVRIPDWKQSSKAVFLEQLERYLVICDRGLKTLKSKIQHEETT